MNYEDLFAIWNDDGLLIRWRLSKDELVIFCKGVNIEAGSFLELRMNRGEGIEKGKKYEISSEECTYYWSYEEKVQD